MTSSPPVSVDAEMGDLCPRCGEEKLDCDITLNLACPRCGPIQGGGFS